MDSFKRKIQVAKGESKAELVFKNASVLDVYSKKFVVCDLAVDHGIIVGLGEYDGETQIDATGKYLLPGLIDAHVHIESGYLTPRRYAEAVLPFGVTGIIADPHEIANVCGEAGLAFMLASSEGLPLDIHYMLPSCVPATPFDHAGCVLTADDTHRLMNQYPFAGLGEMMNYPGLFACDGEVLGKLGAADLIDGHAPGVTGKSLCAYRAAGITTDHECSTPDEALEKIRMGMYVHLRQGTLAKNVAGLIPAITAENMSRFTFCTDDKHIDEVLEKGTITDGIATAVAAGLSPEYAVTMATRNTAECYGLKGVGALIPGNKADLLLCADKAAQKILTVYKNGQKVAENGEICFTTAPTAQMAQVTGTVHIRPLHSEDLVEPFDPKKPVIELLPDSLYTNKIYKESADGLIHAAVIERHKEKGHVGRAYIAGVELHGGAIAQTIGHDSHNIIVAGDNEADMLAAVAALGKDGGIAVVQGGKTIGMLPLPVAGLMTDAAPAEAAETAAQVVAAVNTLSGGNGGQVLMHLAFLPLLVIPELKLSDSGLFDVGAFAFV